MSSKKKTTVAKEDGKPVLVPKGENQPRIRFPEFQNAKEWMASRLIGLSGMGLSNGVFNDPKRVGTGYKLINVSDMYIDTTIDERRLSLLELSLSDFEANQVIHGDIFFTRSSLVKSGIAVSNIYLGTSRDVTFDGHLIRFRANTSNVIPLFAHYLFKTAPIRAQLVARGKSATMTTIGQADVAGVMLLYPEKEEQQKIAECLSSVDELIAAQARKLDALKTHKKGLMQQLFPREGETQPRLRFPEFQNAGEWEMKPLGDICDRIMDGTHFSPKTKDGPRPYLTSKNVKEGRIDLSNLSYISEEEHLEIYKRCPVKLHDVLLTKDGANTGNCALNNLDFEFSLLSSVAVLRGKPRVLLQGFLLQSILSDSIQALISESMSGQAITRITLAKIGGFSIPVTSTAEQQRIADCLTSLDDLITAQTQKLDALKTHKKGLMQQLFPSPEVVEA